MRSNFAIAGISLLHSCLLSPSLHAQCPGTSVGYVLPNFSADILTTGVATWSDLEHISVVDEMASTASYSSSGTAISDALVAADFQFDIPPSASICGIEVEVIRQASVMSATNKVTDGDLRIVVNAAPEGTNHANTSLSWSTTMTTSTYGSNSDTWGLTLTGADVSNMMFGVSLVAMITRANGTVTAGVDAIRMRIHYYDATNGLDEHQTRESLVYPNPASSKISVEAASTIQSFELINCTGTSVLSGTGNGEKTISPDLSTLADGMYLLTLTTENGPEQHQIVIRH